MRFYRTVSWSAVDKLPAVSVLSLVSLFMVSPLVANAEDLPGALQQNAIDKQRESDEAHRKAQELFREAMKSAESSTRASDDLQKTAVRGIEAPEAKKGVLPSNMVVTVALKGWYNNLLTSFRDTSSSLYETTSDSYRLVGIPGLTVRYNKFFMTGSYTPETSYGLDKLYFTQATGNNVRVAIKAKRLEYDASLGYMVLDRLGVAAGYKHLEESFDVSEDHYSSANALLGTVQSRLKKTLDTPFVGVVGSAPIDGPLGVFGSFAYGIGSKWKLQDGSSNNCQYFSGEVGLNYMLPAVSGMGIQAGYKFQLLDADTPSPAVFGTTNTSSNNTKGPFIGVNYTF
ncbi:MAG: hypothetical protein HQL64_01235 [Magnetococcales bacterium]|nr:hypothetical protein [Magnetococcales bacterium]